MIKAVVGANWGDEGKGKITDMLAKEADIIVRFQGGANAGHTIVNNYGKFALHTLPSGVFYSHTTSVIGNGVALNIPVLINELNEIISKGVPAPKIKISDRAQMVMPYHILFDQYEEKVVAAAYHRFKTSDNLFNYRAYLEEELDDCEQNQLPRLALDYARVERCAPGEAAPRVRALIQQQRDALEEMSTLMRQIDQSHIRYRKRAVQRAQFLLLSDRSAQGSVTALLRRYAEDIRSPEQLFEPDDGPVAARLHLYPAAVFGAKPLYPPAAPRTEAPLAPVRTEPLDPDRLRQEQQLLLDYARLAVTEENVALLARQALAARGQVNASTLVEEYPNDFTGIIGLHTYSQSPHREYDITLTGNWVERGGFRFQDFVLTRRKEVNTDGNH